MARRTCALGIIVHAATVRRRLVLALALSAAVHGALLVLGRRDGPPAHLASPSGGPLVVAMVERASSGAPAGDVAPKPAIQEPSREPAPSRAVERRTRQARPQPPGQPAAVERTRSDTARAPVAVSRRASASRRPAATRARATEPETQAPSSDDSPPSRGSAEHAAASSGPRLAAHDAAAGFPSGRADLRPWCRACPTPDYPMRARRRGWQGTVDVDLRLNGDGSVDGARVVRSSGFPALDDAAMAVAQRSRFRVPSTGGALRGKLRYQFRLDRSL